MLFFPRGHVTSPTFISFAVASLALLGLALKSLGSHGNDATRVKNTFSVTFGDEVAMRISKSVHYSLESDEGANEWAMLLPRHGHVVYVDDESSGLPHAYTVTLFHQLKCLDIIREQYISPPDKPMSTFLHHCMNYLRQTIWCRPNLWLESAKNTNGTASRDYDAVCRDWTRVYDEADRNFDAYLDWSQNAPSVAASIEW